MRAVTVILAAVAALAFILGAVVLAVIVLLACGTPEADNSTPSDK